MPAFEMSQGQQSFNMGNEAMDGEDVSANMVRSQKGAPTTLRSRGTVKTRKEKKANVMMREAEQRTQASLKSIAEGENADPNNPT